MLSTFFHIALSLLIYGIIEYYGWQVVKTVLPVKYRLKAKWFYWGLTVILLAILFSYRPFLYRHVPRTTGEFLAATFFILLISKLTMLLFLFPEDLLRFSRFLLRKISSPPKSTEGISRSEFLSRMALLAAAIPAGTLIYGIVVNAYNYQYHKIALKFPNLPDAFHGFKIVQLSDIHSGSFTKTEPLIEAVEKINATLPDLILFTGDLVNNVASEMDSYMEIFGKLKAKWGVLSVTGNHDYGDYVEWDSPEAKKENFEKFKAIHKNLGWDLLLNENRILEKDGQQIAILGVENWGKGRFAKYGKFEETYKGCENIPFKIMMSHDPSSWDLKILPHFKDIDLTLSGHTHGAQFGIESKWLRWSPSQYLYKQWAGIYREGKQLIYVNRGFGFLGYPGRVGILPEVTEITLLKG